MNIVVGRGRSGVGHPEITDSERRHADQIKFGKVQEVDYAKAKVRVLIGDESDEDGHLETGWLPMPGARARNDVEWHPLEVGERVVVLSESGELQNGVVIPAGIYSDDDPAPGDKAGLWRKKFQDGGLIEYDRDSGEFLIDAKSKATTKVGENTVVLDSNAATITIGGATLVVKDGEITLTAGGNTLKLSGAGVEISGGQVKHDGKNIGKDHKHTNVQAGAAVSGPPQ